MVIWKEKREERRSGSSVRKQTPYIRNSNRNSYYENVCEDRRECSRKLGTEKDEENVLWSASGIGSVPIAFIFGPIVPLKFTDILWNVCKLVLTCRVTTFRTIYCLQDRFLLFGRFRPFYISIADGINCYSRCVPRNRTLLIDLFV